MVGLAHPSLLADAAFDAGTAILFILVGVVIARRAVSEENRLAANAFTTWWFGLGAITFVGTITSLLAAFEVLTIPMYMAVIHLALVVLCAACWGLLYYLFYLFTGWRNVIIPVTALYLGTYAALVYIVTAGRPEAILVNRWSVEIKYATPVEGPLVSLIAGLFLIPIILGAFGYFTLVFRIRQRTPRMRVAIVSLSFLLWFGSSGIATVVHISGEDWWQFASRFISLAATLAIYFAYRPTRGMRRALKIEEFDPQHEPQVETPSRNSRFAPSLAY
jgi:hypothetical protein